MTLFHNFSQSVLGVAFKFGLDHDGDLKLSGKVNSVGRVLKQTVEVEVKGEGDE